MLNKIAKKISSSKTTPQRGLLVKHQHTAIRHAHSAIILPLFIGISQTTVANETLSKEDNQAPVIVLSEQITSATVESEDSSLSFLDRFSNEVKSWLYPAKCLQFPNSIIELGAVSANDWQKWLGSHKVKHVGGVEFLELGQEQDDYFLRQELIPSDKGSPRVNISARVKAKRTYRLSQSIYLEPDFDWGRKNQGGKLGFGFGGGTAPTGGQIKPDGFTARFMWRGNVDDSAHIAVYSYAADRSQNVPYGDDHPLTGFDVPIGEWFTLVMEIETNSDVESADGSLTAWANGQKLVELDNIHWQSEGDRPAIQQLMFSTFYGGGSIDWAPNHPTHIRFSDVCWAPVVDGYSAIEP